MKKLALATAIIFAAATDMLAQHKENCEDLLVRKGDYGLEIKNTCAGEAVKPSKTLRMETIKNPCTASETRANLNLSAIEYKDSGFLVSKNKFNAVANHAQIAEGVFNYNDYMKLLIDEGKAVTVKEGTGIYDANGNRTGGKTSVGQGYIADLSVCIPK